MRLPSRLQRPLQSLLSQEPAAQLIRSTARQQWRLIVLNLGSSLVEAFTEGATLAVVFLAVEVLSAPAGTPFNWASNPIVSRLPAAANWLNALPATGVFASLLALAVLLQALQSLTRFLSQVSVGYFAARCKALVTARIHSQVLSFSFPCASGYKVGDLTDYAGNGPEAIRIQIEVSSQLLVGVLLIATYLAVLVGISPWLLLAVLVMGGLITMVQKQLLPRIRAGSQAVSQAQVAISSRITEDFQGLRLLHSSGQLDGADQHLLSRMGELELQLRGQVRRLAVVGPFSSFLPILAIAVIAGLSLLLLGGRSTGVLPSLVTFVLALQRLNVRLSGVAGTFNQLADNSGRLARLNQLLSPAGKQFRRQSGISFRQLQGQIRFEGVGLRYAPEIPPSLGDISFALQKGQMLALVGPSGAGKSSIADLLTGLYAPSDGEIWIDDIAMGELDLSSWQQRLGVVSQDTFMFNGTIAENIGFGTPGATLSLIQAACAAAQAAGFIESLPQGYDTLVGERGYRLSGGQRQRLSLARAILRDPELLILDEATSALDSQSERLVQEAIERFERNHTVLVIAHRLSTIVRADQILVLEGGRIVQRGSHTSLLAAGGLYAQLWQQQSQITQPSHA
ncbi:ABC transporter ATP-binding protein [Cyanobium sp. Maggiore-St4-Cus]|uniref:ABC transporter ATP-binding protein n=1 Tax=Cyanobium sp. Maggiore-St4-Cus TaxID=2823717 RepID=UPI0020CBFA64|nr:ABC transporter ATP-binding protein [Cyanobium sp. Maggiore-St4-Cus]MCP9787666.1 ABC transporter ATP-binding protein [Cyanobium sp. Maggiore-St4-Cus]